MWIIIDDIKGIHRAYILKNDKKENLVFSSEKAANDYAACILNSWVVVNMFYVVEE